MLLATADFRSPPKESVDRDLMTRVIFSLCKSSSSSETGRLFGAPM